ncbi:MAG: hypothetical protein J3R72DRAFT_496691 [Linnemannia gamsii]|nr:MAG: hypothetical protein J3R72DRAFT_496691 [Linnemannia gamsii]
MLAHNPNLADIQMPPVTVVSDTHQIAELIAERCLKSRSLKNLSLVGNTATWELLLRILQELPEQQVRKLQCLARPFIIHCLDDARSLFRKHLGISRYTALAGCSDIDSKAIQVIWSSGRPALGDIKSNSFPGMLSLSCETTRRPEYLHRTAGSTKLRVLEGSVLSTTRETKVVVGMLEAKWMEKHYWPALVVAHFVGKAAKLPDHFR